MSFCPLFLRIICFIYRFFLFSSFLFCAFFYRQFCFFVAIFCFSCSLISATTFFCLFLRLFKSRSLYPFSFFPKLSFFSRFFAASFHFFILFFVLIFLKPFYMRSRFFIFFVFFLFFFIFRSLRTLILSPFLCRPFWCPLFLFIKSFPRPFLLVLVAFFLFLRPLLLSFFVPFFSSFFSGSF